MSTKYGMTAGATYELTRFMNDITTLAKKKKLATDNDKLLDIVTDGVLNFEQFCTEHDLKNYSSMPMMIISVTDLTWVVTEYDLCSPISAIKEVNEKGYLIVSLPRVGAKTLKDNLAIITDLTKITENISKEVCDMINNHPKTISYYTKLKPTMKSMSINGSYDIFMRLSHRLTFRDVLDVFLGRNTRPARLKKWLLKNKYAEIVKNI